MASRRPFAAHAAGFHRACDLMLSSESSSNFLVKRVQTVAGIIDPGRHTRSCAAKAGVACRSMHES